MNDSTIAFRAKEQLGKFLGKVFTHFSRPRQKFLADMEHVTMIRDASRSSKEGRDVLVHGYHGCMAVACQNGKRKTHPLALRLWSSNAPGHK